MTTTLLPIDTDEVKCAVAYVRPVMETFDGSHDWSHIERVLGHADRIVSAPDFAMTVDAGLVALGCVLHDVADHKYATTRGITTDDAVAHCLAHLRIHAGVDGARSERVQEIMRWTSYSAVRDARKSGAAVPTFVELDVVRDADRLDALGAVGIARAAMYGATRGSSLVRSSSPTVAEWKADGCPVAGEDGSVAGHFFAKLLHLPGTLATAPAMRMAPPLVSVMEGWLDALVAEGRAKAGT